MMLGEKEKCAYCEQPTLPDMTTRLDGKIYHDRCVDAAYIRERVAKPGMTEESIRQAVQHELDLLNPRRS